VACGAQGALEAGEEHLGRGDELARRRQELPWVPVEKEYVLRPLTGEGRAPAFPPNVRFIRGDPEGGEGSGRVVGVVTEGSGEVDRPGAAERADGKVAQAGHDVGARAGANLGGALGQGGVAEVVQAVLDRPVPAEGVGGPGGAGLGQGGGW
jgi:hypothetical protein